MSKQFIQLAFGQEVSQLEQANIRQIAEQVGLTQDEWDLDHEEFQGTKTVLKYAKVVRAKKISIMFPIPSGISLSRIRFEKLKHLGLAGCGLMTIEFLVGLQAPMMEYLDLSNNYISNCRSLRKCKFPHIQRLQLQYNRIVQLDHLFQFFGNTDNLLLHLEEFDSDKICENLNFLTKLPMKLSKICKFFFIHTVKVREGSTIQPFGK